MSLLKRVAASFREQRDGSNAWVIPPPGGGMQHLSTAGTTVTDKTALGIIAFYAGVRLLADTVSLTPLRAMKVDAFGIRVPIAAPDQPVQITDPFMDLTLEEGLGQLVTSLILRGNAYLITVGWDKLWNPIQWFVLHPDQVHVERDKNGYREYTVNGKVYDSSLITHVAGFMLPGAVTGAGLVEHCRNSLGLGIALDEVAGSFFRNGVMSTGIVSTDIPLSPDEAKAAAEMFVQNHSGTKRAHLPVVLGGGAKYTPISLTPDDAQFLESRDFQRGEIATLLGLPPHLLGIVDKTTSWGTGIEVQGRAFLDYTLKGYYGRFEPMFTRWMPEYITADFEKDSIARAETKERYAYYNQAFVTGWMNKDEIRLREGLAPLPNGAGQIYYVSTLLTPASDQQGVIAAAPAAAMPSTNPNSGDLNAGD